MARKIAGACALLAFAFCLIQGIDAENTFATTLRRALIGMGATFVVGLVVGAMFEGMHEENVKSRKKNGNSEAEAVPHDR